VNAKRRAISALVRGPSQGSPDPRSTDRPASFFGRTRTAATQPAMASLSRSSLLPQCSSCIRRVARQSQGLDSRAPLQQQTRSISKAAKEAERNIVVKLLKDVPRYGRAGMAQGSNAGERAWLTSTRLICSSQPGHDAQSMVSRPRCRLRTVPAIEGAEVTGG
jgi:hypothetical protein